MNASIIASALRRGTRIGIASHAHPDGDAIGSSIALGMALRSLGKDVVVFNTDSVPYNLSFLPGASDVSADVNDLKDCDLIVIADCATPKRVGEAFEAFVSGHTNIVVIDHHEGVATDPERQWVAPDAPATGEMVAQVIAALNVDLTPEISQNLYCALVVDTGFFRHSNSTPRVFELAAELVRAGAEPAVVSREMENQSPPAKLKLLSLVLPTLEFVHEGKVASLVLTQDMLNEAGALAEHADEFVYMPRSVRGVEVAIVFREVAPNRFKASMRSKAYVNVQAVAAQFEGGGHFHAAGCTLEGRLGDAKSAIYQSIAALL